MDKMSVWSVLLVSFPEELLIVIITLALAGYKNILNFKDKGSLLKLFLSPLLMVIFSFILRATLTSITLVSTLQFVLYYLIIIAIYRHKIFACIPAFTVSILILVASEAIFASFIFKLFNLNLQQVYASDLTRILQSLPARFIQLTCVFIICKVKNINLNMVKLSVKDWINIVIFGIIIIINMLSIESGLKNEDNDYISILNLIVNVSLTVIFSTWMIYNMFRLRKKILLNENVHDVELHHIKQLIEEGRTNYALELIDLTLKERGYYR